MVMAARGSTHKGQPHRAWDQAQACKFGGPKSKNVSLYVWAWDTEAWFLRILNWFSSSSPNLNLLSSDYESRGLHHTTWAQACKFGGPRSKILALTYVKESGALSQDWSRMNFQVHTGIWKSIQNNKEPSSTILGTNKGFYLGPPNLQAWARTEAPCGWPLKPPIWTWKSIPNKRGTSLRQSSTILRRCKGSSLSGTLAHQSCKLELELKLCEATLIS